MRTEILDAVMDLAHQFREHRQVTQGIALGMSFSGGSSVSRSRTLAEPSASTDGLRDAAMAVSNVSGWSGPGCAESRSASSTWWTRQARRSNCASTPGRRTTGAWTLSSTGSTPATVTRDALAHRRHST
ncbi:hypothetical protein PV350_18860 [Streptomyces sp. PA03-6a]|nr:hypothetical protein [Streptomyces sp. PA03-6a]